MKCPSCEEDYEKISLRAAGGEIRQTRRCPKCGSFWFERGSDQELSLDSVTEVDSPQPNYSLQTYSLICPNDQTLLEQSENDSGPNGLKVWNCADCRGKFYPRGQLALYSQWLSEHSPTKMTGYFSRTQAALTLTMISVGAMLTLSAATKQGILFEAASADPLPTASPNVLTLVLLALTYVAGTILAVLGRKIPIIFMGWGVIAICLFGFFVIIFGP